MCIQCHQGLSDAAVVQQIKEAFQYPHFEQWNTTSVSHMYIAYSGVNGREAQILAGQIIEKLIQWSRANNRSSVEDSLIPDPFANIDNIERAYLKMKKDPNLVIQADQIPERKKASIPWGFFEEIYFLRED